MVVPRVLRGVAATLPWRWPRKFQRENRCFVFSVTMTAVNRVISRELMSAGLQGETPYLSVFFMTQVAVLTNS